MQSNNSILQILPSEREDRRLEVVLDETNGEPYVALRYATWTDGLGWCRQKTIELDTAQLDELHRALTVVRHRIKRRRAEAGETVEPSKVIHLPRVA